MKLTIIVVLGVISLGSTFMLILTMGSGIIIASTPTSQIIQHELSLFDAAKNIVGESNELNKTEASLNNGLANLSLINGEIIMILTFTGFISLILFTYGKYLKSWRFTAKLGEATSVTIGICFGIMILFYTAADLTNLSIEQTTTEILTTVISNQKVNDNQIKFLENFVLEKISQYRVNIESSISFGLISLYVMISFVWHQIRRDSIYPHILFYIVIGCIIMWSIEYMLNIIPQNSSIIPCPRVHC